MVETIVIFTALFLSITYLFIGYGITKRNAKYLLAGYNTMSQEKRESFDIDNYLKFFKRFFKASSLFPPFSYLLFSLFLIEDYLVIAWSLSQILPFALLLSKSLKFGK